MSESTPDKKDLEIIFRRLRSIPTNKVCFDCTAKNPTWASITYGVFICIDCSAVHRSLGVHLTFVRSTQLDTNWTWLQIRQMQLGGNANAESFFQQHNCTSRDAQQKYNSRAAQLYKEKLQNAALHANKVHGTKLHIDQNQDSHQEEVNKEVDFFEEHSFLKDLTSSTINDREIEEEHNSVIDRRGPSVTTSSSGTPDRKSLIGSRKPQPKKLGLGNKRGTGLGAQKATTSFADVEKEAELSEKLKVQVQKENEEIKKEIEPAQITSMRLAYEDLSLKQKKEEEKLKAIDPKKATQMERLGMGLGARVGISHSAVSDMKTIHQENSSKFNKVSDIEVHNFFDDFGFSSNSSSSFSPLYKNSSQSRSISASSGDNEDSFVKVNMPYDNGGYNSNTSGSYDKSYKTQSSYNNGYKTQNNNVKRNVNLHSESSNDAQKKFGGAKSISSDQYFSDPLDNSWEQKSNLSRFEGSTSISSADYFGRNEQAHQRGGGYISSQLQPPDLEEVRESVKQSVTKVAGKLSSLASGVISSIQDKYGGY